MDQFNDLMSNFTAASESLTASTSAFAQREVASGTPTLKINMRNRDNQGTIMFIPLMDQKNQPFFASVVNEVNLYARNKNNEPFSMQRQLLEKRYYQPLTPEGDARWEKLNSDFMTVYSNREMLSNTDWAGDIARNKYYGFYGLVLSHTNPANVQIKDAEGKEHRGRVAFIKLKGAAFVDVWNAFINSQVAMGQQPAQFVPRIFGSTEFRQSLLNLTCMQGADKKFTMTLSEYYFSSQVPHLVNDAATNPTQYHMDAKIYEQAKDLAKEFINTTTEGALIEEPRLDDFERACRAIANCFNFYTARGAEAYETYQANMLYNEVDQAGYLAGTASLTGAAPTIAEQAQVVPPVEAVPVAGGNPLFPGAAGQAQAVPGAPIPGSPVAAPVPGAPIAPPAGQPIPGAPMTPPAAPVPPVPGQPMPGVPGGFPGVAAPTAPAAPQWGAAPSGIPTPDTNVPF